MLIADAGFEARLKEGLQALASPDAEAYSDVFARFLGLLEKWNRAFNLTAVRDLEEMVARHILDSLSVRPFLYGSSVLDVGTGAGFPGLPLAILEPERRFCLLDSGGKKVRFVRHAVAELQIDNVAVIQARVEKYAPEELFDTVMCRAFASIGKFVGLCGGLAGAGGRLLAMKGRFPDDELGSLLSVRRSFLRGQPPWEATQIASVRIPGLAVQRHIVVIERRETEPCESKREGHDG